MLLEKKEHLISPLETIQDVEIIMIKLGSIGRTTAITMNIHTWFLCKPIQLIKNTSIRAFFLNSSNNMKAMIGMELDGSIWLQK